MLERRTIRGAAFRIGRRASRLAQNEIGPGPQFACSEARAQCFADLVQPDDGLTSLNAVSEIERKSRLPQYIAGPKAVIILLVLAVTLCLGTLIYVQHANSLIVDHDMQTAVSLSELAARFDHEDGNLYRLLVDASANGRAADSTRRLINIRHRISQISADLARQREALDPRDITRATRVVAELGKYDEAVGVVSSMLEVDFSTSVAMLRPFRANADRVLAEVKAIAASGIADAHRHAEDAAWRTRWLVALVTAAVLIVAGLSYAWLALAAERGVQLTAEITRRGIAEQEALKLARTDALTGLVNRREFGNALEIAIDAAMTAGRGLSVVLLDLDGFKDANDMHGHAAGDTVLMTVAHRLHSVCGDYATIARLGGDEFAIIVPDEGSTGDAMALAYQASLVLHQPLAWRSNTITVGASIGVSRFPNDGVAGSELLHAADIAMYEAKRGSKGGVCLFSPSMEAERFERRRMEQELRDGIGRSEVKPFYQPIVRFSDGGLCGFEILARWHHPRLGLLAPDAFIRLADSTGQITAMTNSILRQACIDARQIPAHLRLALNISPTQFEEPGLAEALIAIILAEGVSPSRFEIEITEDAVMDDIVAAERVLATFRQSGISVALDDFGTGYSSLSNLRRLRFDKIKIDQSFVTSLTDSVESEKIVDAIISLALSFGMKVTAEGIEDAAVAAMLSLKGCTQGQGYLFGKPASFTETVRLFSTACQVAA
jgi:diguanylate cyclase (GGDEF)-like protein